MALRPRSFPIAIAPVLVGASTALLQKNTFNIWGGVLALLASLLMQAITNLQNDIGFTQRGAEAIGERVGLPRATALGVLSMRQVRQAIWVLCMLAALVGLELMRLRGLGVLVIGVASLLAALAYMGGPKPIAYTPWGELTVLLFFGWIAVAGSCWVIGATVEPAALWAGTATGAMAAATLALNNYRDRTHDAMIGRRTFAVVFGPVAGRRLVGALMGSAFVAVLGLSWKYSSPMLAAPVLLAPLAWRLQRDVSRWPEGNALNALLFRSFQLNLWFALAFCLGAMVSVGR